MILLIIILLDSLLRSNRLCYHENCWLQDKSCCLTFSYFLCFCVGASEARSLVGGFNPLQYFSWSILRVAGLKSSFSPPDWSSQWSNYSPMCTGHQAWSPAPLRKRKTSWNLLQFLVNRSVQDVSSRWVQSKVHFRVAFTVEAFLLCVLGATAGHREFSILWAQKRFQLAPLPTSWCPEASSFQVSWCPQMHGRVGWANRALNSGPEVGTEEFKPLLTSQGGG
jgi:hypothetical protein